MGDFNVKPNDVTVENFCQIYGCENIAKDKKCFKNPINPTCINLMIINRPKPFQKSEVIETGLSDFKGKGNERVIEYEGNESVLQTNTESH